MPGKKAFPKPTRAYAVGMVWVWPCYEPNDSIHQDAIVVEGLEASMLAASTLWHICVCQSRRVSCTLDSSIFIFSKTALISRLVWIWPRVCYFWYEPPSIFYYLIHTFTSHYFCKYFGDPGIGTMVAVLEVEVFGTLYSVGKTFLLVWICLPSFPVFHIFISSLDAECLISFRLLSMDFAAVIQGLCRSLRVSSSLNLTTFKLYLVRIPDFPFTTIRSAPTCDVFVFGGWDIEFAPVASGVLGGWLGGYRYSSLTHF